MLEELNVHNYALIERVNIKFTRGLNVLSGETGAGKSILIGALGLLLGQAADTSIVRSGAEETLISGVVNVEQNPEALQWLKEHGVEAEEGGVILRRSVKKAGRGGIFIQSTPVTRKDLEELSALLFDLHGQHEHQSLLKAENHRKLLDRFGGTEDLCARTQKLHALLSSLNERYSKSVATERERLREADLLSFAIREIEEAGLRENEEEELANEQKILANHERLFMLVEDVYTSLAENRQGAVGALRKCKNAMDEIVQIDHSLAGIGNQLQDAFYEIQDFTESIRSYKSAIEYDPERLGQVEDRLALIHTLEKKYGDTIPEVLKYLEKSKKDLSDLENWENEKHTLEAQIKKTEQEFYAVAKELSEKRKTAAVSLQQQVEAELEKLSMARVKFRVLIQNKEPVNGQPVVSQYGLDNIEFVMAANPGEPFKRLRAVASGGELSRVMLAIKTILAESDNINTLIFDEVDAGIGGQVALAVGEHLKELSRYKQVLCITHLATIAVRADNHLKVAKQISDNRTITQIERLSEDKRKEELSRMLAGDVTDKVALQHAEELMRKYSTAP